MNNSNYFCGFDGRYHFVYKTIHIPTGHFYIGKRSTKKHPDEEEYFGSGTRIKEYLSLFPKSDFSRTILQFFNSSEEAYEAENQIIGLDYLLNECLNCHEGGLGGFDYINNNNLNNISPRVGIYNHAYKKHWIINVETGKTKRISSNSPVPDGFILGRKIPTASHNQTTEKQI